MLSFTLYFVHQTQRLNQQKPAIYHLPYIDGCMITTQFIPDTNSGSVKHRY